MVFRAFSEGGHISPLPLSRVQRTVTYPETGTGKNSQTSDGTRPQSICNWQVEGIKNNIVVADFLGQVLFHVSICSREDIRKKSSGKY